MPDLDKLTDEELYKLVQNGDMDAFDSICLRHKDKLGQFIFKRVGNREDAKDIVQDVLMDLLKNCKYNSSKASLARYLYWSAKAMSSELLRTRGRTISIEDAGDGLGAGVQYIEDELEKKEILNAVKEVVKELPEKSQEIMDLYLIAKLNLAEISTLLNENSKSVRSRFLRICKILGEKLSYLRTGSNSDEESTEESRVEQKSNGKKD